MGILEAACDILGITDEERRELRDRIRQDTLRKAAATRRRRREQGLIRDP